MATDKKRLQQFHAELLKFGCVKGFRHFATHLRGKEELICSVINEPSVPILLSATNSPANSMARHDRGTLRDSDTVTMSQKLQRRLSGYGFINIGLPPASPSGSEENEDESYTMFLLAAYTRYNGPYVWIRSNHERIIHFSDEDRSEKDYPLQLKSTTNWHQRAVSVTDIVAELVEVCTLPCPPNPFEVDFDFFEALPVRERALATAAMISFMRQLLTSGTHDYDRRVRADLLRVSRLHFYAMLQLLSEGVLSANNQPLTNQLQSSAVNT